MALLGVAVNYIGKLIEENQRKSREANQAAIDGTNELMSAEDRYWARKKDREEKTKQDTEQAIAQRQRVTEEFLQSQDIRAVQIMKREYEKQAPLVEMVGGTITAYGLSRDPKIQEEVQRIIAEEAKKSGINTPEAKSTSFKGPEGFSNVIGVGPNPVIEAMNLQLEEAQKQTSLLQTLVDRNPFSGADFTKSSPTPSRAALLR